MKHVLIIDDDQKIRKIIQVQLGKTSYRLFEAADRDQARSLMCSEQIDVVLCDIKMKDTSGFVILEELKRMHPHVPVIMLTGFIDKKVLDRAKELGSYDCITKPVRREKLIETIANACGEK